MYKVLLRDVTTGEKHWYDGCYLNGKMKKNLIIFWKPPDGDRKVKMKVIAWQWQGFDKYIPKKQRAIYDFVDQTLLSLDIPPKWREELLKYQRES